jgi:hypothetical protein
MSDLIVQPAAPKVWWKSKTILVNLVMGLAMIVGVFLPEVGEFIKTHFAETGGAWALINIVLRIVTKQELEK